jgi:hypothetical protein
MTATSKPLASVLLLALSCSADANVPEGDTGLGGSPNAGPGGAQSSTAGSGGSESLDATTSTGGSGGHTSDSASGGSSNQGGKESADASSKGGGRDSGGSSVIEAGPPSDSGPSRVSYTTNFDLTESPISEGGAWHHTDPNQKTVATSGGFAYGTQSGTSGFDDSNAFLSGFPANQRVTAVIHKDLSHVTGSGYLEVEILLRWSEGATRSTPYGDTKSYGYEINLALDGGYWNIGRFKENPALYSGFNVGPINDGDVFEADIMGNTITARLNGKVIGSATDKTLTPFTTGNPGIGFYREKLGGAMDAYSFTSFTAEGI